MSVYASVREVEGARLKRIGTAAPVPEARREISRQTLDQPLAAIAAAFDQPIAAAFASLLRHDAAPADLTTGWKTGRDAGFLAF